MRWRLEALRALMHGEASWSAWEAAAALLEGWPEAEDRGVGLVYLHEGLDGWSRRPEVRGERPSVSGLWRARRVERGEGEIDDTGMGGWEWGEPLRLRARVRELARWESGEIAGMGFMLELRPDGRFRELDLSVRPLMASGRVLEPVGVIYRAGGGFEGAFAPDERGFERCASPAALDGAPEATLTWYDPDEIIHDAVEVAEGGGSLRRTALLVWDAAYATRVAVDYALVGRLAS